MRRIGIVLAIVLLLSMGGCAKDLITGKKTLNLYGIKTDVKFGEKVLSVQAGALKKKGKRMDAEADPAEYERIQNIVARLSPVTHYPGFPYEAHLADVDVVNAWCAPGGKIMVYTGLFSPKEGLVEKGNETQLAAVIAHEIAHANARHVTEAISKSTMIAIAGIAVQTAIHYGGSAEGANLFGEIFSEGMNIYIPSYSRKNEFEADREGLFYMAKAGYDPRVAVELWKKAAKKKKDRMSIYASHPSSGARAAALEELLPEAMRLYEEAIAKEGKNPIAR